MTEVIIDWTMCACPHCGWQWHHPTKLKQHLVICHGVPDRTAGLHAAAICAYVSRLQRTLDRDGVAPPAEKSQVSEIKRPRRVRS